jgi:hypothetical protein
VHGAATKQKRRDVRRASIPSIGFDQLFVFVLEPVLDFVVSIFMAVESILCVVSIFIPVSIAVGAGAGAMAGVVVSAVSVLSDLEQAAATASVATRARRFMQISCVEFWQPSRTLLMHADVLCTRDARVFLGGV